MYKKTVTFTTFDKTVTANYTVFETVAEAIELLGETEVLAHINYAHKVTERARAYNQTLNRK